MSLVKFSAVTNLVKFILVLYVIFILRVINCTAKPSSSQIDIYSDKVVSITCFS